MTGVQTCALPISNDYVYDYITDRVVPNVCNYYMISTNGYVYNRFSKKFLSPGIDSKGYPYVMIYTNVSKRKACRIHRLVLMTFDYFEGCENVIINHKDGNKLNPDISNLEWSTFSDNMIHAYAHNLINMPSCENSHMSKHTNEQTHAVCKLLEDRVPVYEIIKKLNVSRHFVESILHKVAWRGISDNYNLPSPMTNADKRIFSEDQIHLICGFFQNNKRDINMPVATYMRYMLCTMGIDISRSTIESATKIYNRKTCKDISKNYDF